ncbi:hypothetical protein GCM10028798_35620 [Humibacter antri]
MPDDPLAAVFTTGAAVAALGAETTANDDARTIAARDANPRRIWRSNLLSFMRTPSY